MMDEKTKDEVKRNWQTIAFLTTVLFALLGFLVRDIYTRTIDDVRQNREDIHRLEIYIEGLKHRP